MNGKNRKDIKPGLRVHITQKQDQRSGRFTSGVVKDVLTKSAYHPHEIKVRLKTGELGRVQEIVEISHEAEAANQDPSDTLP
jgi:uncharacterized repeat protein (TIGR03833 family)